MKRSTLLSASGGLLLATAAGAGGTLLRPNRIVIPAFKAKCPPDCYTPPNGWAISFSEGGNTYQGQDAWTPAMAVDQDQEVFYVYHTPTYSGAVLSNSGTSKINLGGSLGWANYSFSYSLPAAPLPSSYQQTYGGISFTIYPNFDGNHGCQVVWSVSGGRTIYSISASPNSDNTELTVTFSVEPGPSPYVQTFTVPGDPPGSSVRRNQHHHADPEFKKCCKCDAINAFGMTLVGLSAAQFAELAAFATVAPELAAIALAAYGLSAFYSLKTAWTCS